MLEYYTGNTPPVVHSGIAVAFDPNRNAQALQDAGIAVLAGLTFPGTSLHVGHNCPILCQ
ncbi:MAG: hypothetical protein POELPBGB_04268 [Bacteroidia bacterium]|nr:hypothetical protein [Bacteroidia bacterium]